MATPTRIDRPKVEFRLTEQQAVALFNSRYRQLELETLLNAHDFENRDWLGIPFSLSFHGRRAFHDRWHAAKAQHMAERGWPEYQRAIRAAGLVSEAA